MTINSKQGFGELVEKTRSSLESLSVVNRGLSKLDLEEDGPIDDQAAEVMRDHLPAVRDAIDALISARNELAALWLRSGENRDELSVLTGIPIHELRAMSLAANAGTDME